MAVVATQAVPIDKSILPARRRPVPLKPAPRLRFYADVVVHGSAYPLLAAEVAFRCLHPNVPQKELDLIQHARLLVPLRRHPLFACPTDTSEQSFGRNSGCGHPLLDGFFDPFGNRHGSNVWPPLPTRSTMAQCCLALL